MRCAGYGCLNQLGPCVKHWWLELPLINVMIIQKYFYMWCFFQIQHFKPMPPPNQKMFFRNFPNADPFQHPCVPIRKFEGGLQKYGFTSAHPGF